jgi:hypothetical protein
MKSVSVVYIYTRTCSIVTVSMPMSTTSERSVASSVAMLCKKLSCKVVYEVVIVCTAGSQVKVKVKPCAESVSKVLDFSCAHMIIPRSKPSARSHS